MTEAVAETEAVADKTIVRWFKYPKQVGEVRLLPSDIDHRVLIRKPKIAKSGGYGYCSEFSVVCMVNPRRRIINMDLGETEFNGINTPKLIFQYDYNNLNADSSSNIGYLYKPTTDEGTLAEILPSLKSFRFRPHVYISAYMCLRNKKHGSPRVLNNVFWDSNFWGTQKSYEDQMVMEDQYTDKSQQKTISNYEDFFEINKKPAAIFTSNDPRVLAKAKSSIFPGKDYVVGFAWLVKNRWWVYLKNNVFMRLKPEQVKVI